MIRKEFKTESEVSRCLLCHDAPCTKVCIGGEDPATVIRSMRFDNELGAAARVGKNACADCSAPCVDACIRGKADRPVEIPFLLKTIAEDKKETPEKSGKADLSVTFCGVKCENPFFLSSSIVGSNDEMVAKAFEMGWGGVAFKTIGAFRPEEASPRFSAISKEDTPFVGFKNIEQISDHPLAENLEYLRRLKRDYPTKVIIASIMGQNEEEWEMLARECENAGADIIECNFSWQRCRDESKACGSLYSCRKTGHLSSDPREDDAEHHKRRAGGGSGDGSGSGRHCRDQYRQEHHEC